MEGYQQFSSAEPFIQYWPQLDRKDILMKGIIQVNSIKGPFFFSQKSDKDWFLHFMWLTLNFLQACLLLGTVPGVKNVAYGPPVCDCVLEICKIQQISM